MNRAVGTFVKTASPHVVEVLATSGIDFAVLDAEHAPFGRAELDRMIMAGRASGLPVFVRVPDHRPSTILSALDMGAAGLVLPHVDSVEQARAIVAAARFSDGKRGYSGSPRYAGYGSLGRKAAIQAGDDALILLQIESAAGLDAVEEIASVPGIDGVFIGRADLSLSLGEDSIAAPTVERATRRIVAAAVARKLRVGLFVYAADEIAAFADAGVDWFVVGSDHTMIRVGGAAIAAAGIPSQTRGRTA